MITKLKLLKILLNPYRREILKQVNKVDTAVAILERQLSPISHGYLWKNINLLKKNKLIHSYPYPLTDHKPKKYIGGRPYFTMVTPHIEKKTLDKINKEIEEIKKLVEEAYKEHKKRKKYTG